MKIRILSSGNNLEFHNELEPNIWQNEALNSEIRPALLKIAKDFFKSLKLPVAIEDIRFTGSLANYNYTRYSDIDLHIVVDFSKITKDTKLVKEFFDSKRIIWNQKHAITIKGYEVEIYVENLNEKHFSTGVHSVLNNEWIVKPSSEKPDFDKGAALKKAGHLMKEINAAIEPPRELSDLERIKEKIKKMRKCGLSHGGEYSVENLAFKFLRRKGYIKKLHDAYTKEYDKGYSLPEEVIKT